MGMKFKDYVGGACVMFQTGIMQSAIFYTFSDITIPGVPGNPVCNLHVSSSQQWDFIHLFYRRAVIVSKSGEN